MADSGILQVIQYQKTGKISVTELPAPAIKPGGILVQNRYSIISAGTERSSVETAQASMVGKARSRPDLVKQVLDNARTDGWVATYQKVQNRLANYKELGYSSAGVVVASDVDTFRVGDRVACAGYAYHAEIVSVPKNLAVHMPDNVSFEDASYATLGAIAMQGVRRADVRIGEAVVVVGLGLIGLLTVQILKAAGCRVLGVDISKANFDLALRLGCEACIVSDKNAVRNTLAFTRGYGSDAVLLTAATRANDPLEFGLKVARKHSPIIVVGSVGMNVVRGPFYDKELDLKIATSYGPGRYDTSYEEHGHDYPIDFVRWTENRNLESFLDLVSSGAVNVNALTTHKIPVRDALRAYDMITGKVRSRYIGILLEYDTAPKEFARRVTVKSEPTRKDDKVVCGFIGAGNFAQSYLLPPLVEAGATLKGVMTTTPVNANSVAEKFKFQFVASDGKEIINDPSINAVFIASRHDSHAEYARQAISAGKHVFVEKPLAITPEQLDALVAAARKKRSGPAPVLTVGFNRRYADIFKDIRAFFEGAQEPLSMIYRVNAGFMPLAKWMQDPTQGGRFVGEGCHFIDCMAYLTNAVPVRVSAERTPSRNHEIETNDNLLVTIKFSDGSAGQLQYLGNGDSSLPKEYCEVFGAGRCAIMDDFTEARFFEAGKKTKKTYNHQKGHREEVRHFVDVVLGKETPSLSLESMVATTRATFGAIESLKTGQIVTL